MTRARKYGLLALIAAAACGRPVWATQYFTVEQVQRQLFPDAEHFVSQPMRLTAAQKDFVEDYADVRLRADEQPVWRVEAQGALAGWLVVDEVYGKHEFITYAVGLNPDGSVKGMEIMDYRETHGGAVRNPAWRAQLTGKRYGDALKMDQDIDNISGATLSVKHITEGVRRILAIYQAVLKTPAGLQTNRRKP